jgi:eukaryotic-like serine/threonine-protein kinase
MGAVHIGSLVGPAGFARTVAIKRMHPHLSCEPTFVTMFLDEARLAARVDHPNVVATLDVVAESGEILLVMEYVRGLSLVELRGRAMPLPIASAIVVGVLDGLQAAHEAVDANGRPLSIVHRDVSPQNVLVGADGIARVADFGIAKAFGRLQTTNEGHIKGKAGYMSPEQVAGVDIDHRTDVFATGVLLWELAAGRRLFDSDSPLVSMRRVLEETPPRLDAVRPDLPPAFVALVARALAQSKDARFASARDMALGLASAVPPARATEVAAWIETAAPDVLARRLKLAALTEANLGAGAAAPPATPPEKQAALTGSMLGTADPGDEAPAERRWPRRTKARAAVAASAFGLGLAALVVARSRAAPAPAAPVASSPPPVETAAPPLLPSDLPAADRTPPAPDPAPLATGPARAPRHAGSATTRKPKPGCDPPFTWSADGKIRLPKRECF